MEAMKTAGYLFLAALFLLGCSAVLLCLWPFLWWLRPEKETDEVRNGDPGPGL